MNIYIVVMDIINYDVAYSCKSVNTSCKSVNTSVAITLFYYMMLSTGKQQHHMMNKLFLLVLNETHYTFKTIAQKHFKTFYG